MFKLQVDLQSVLKAVGQSVKDLGIPLENKQVVARLVVEKDQVVGAEVGIGNLDEDMSSFYPVPKEPIKRTRKPKDTPAASE